MDIEQLKSRIITEVESHSQELCELSRQIHSTPEMGFQEHQAVRWITDYLEKNGFDIQRNFCNLPTAFRANYGSGQPTIAILAEYDALPGIGHACGHNLIAAAAAGAGLGAKPVIDTYGGRVSVIGTPAEELYSGKQRLAECGAFTDLDAAMMVHPSTFDTGVTYAMACQGLDVEFFGKAAHAAGKPEAGINALEAMILSFNAIDSLRQHIRQDAKIHGIITDGGQVANIVPDHSAGNFLVRAGDVEYLEELKQRVLNCFKGAAEATGARLEYKWEEYYYAPMLNNLSLGRLFVNNMRQLGRQARLEPVEKYFGSTDFGNVSQLVPGMHALIAVAPPGTSLHSPEFHAAAISEKGLNSMLQAAKAMAMVVADLISGPETLSKVKKEFFGSKGYF